MKRVLVLLTGVVFIIASCSHKGPVTYTSTGYLRGQILTNMACGYGYVITTETTTQKFIDPLPAGSGIDLKTATFPIRINYNWHKKADPNPCNFIVIDAIVKAD